ncbi:MAG: DUF707 domain-containing protein [Gammaproteobacteria bacterium]|nr:DUF707 domain-containing protein [Gammaproteobacteria bacterium]
MEVPRKYLVFARVGAKSLHHEWLIGEEDRLWDIQLSQYDDDPEIGKGGDLPLSVDKGTKWDSIYRYLTGHIELLDRYRYMMFMDDDLSISCDAINRVFRICEEYDLYVAQPALHPDSYFCYPILLQCSMMKLRYGNFVECMAPALRTDYLRTILPQMSDLQSGWGIDQLWTVFMEEPSFRSAIIDAVTVLHTRPHAVGDVYNAFQKKRVDPERELRERLDAFEGVPERMLVYGAITKGGAQLNGGIARLLNGAYLTVTTPRYKDKRRAIRSGLGMIVRSVTQAGYRPTQVREAHVAELVS